MKMKALEVRITNDAQYQNTGNPLVNPDYPDGTNIYIPVKLVAGKRMQVVFACKDGGCSDAYDDLFEYTGLFEPGTDPLDEQAVEDWKADKNNPDRGPRPQVATLDGRVSFTMGCLLPV